MSQSRRKNLGNLRIERGDLYAKRATKARRGPRRARELSDEAFDREIASIYASWNSDTRIAGSVGGYPSRAIANTAQRLQWPLRVANKHMTTALRAKVDVEMVAQLGDAIRKQAYRIRDALRRQQAGVA